jgi:pSer/pThr/pTyr-binding forkhead associated (FHA) protein
MSRTTTKIIIRHKDGGVVSEHDLEEGEHLIGRDQSSEIFVSDEYVSRQHARLIISADAIEIKDLNSTSGTFLDDVRVSDRIPVHLGQKVRISDFYLDISQEALVEPVESTRLVKTLFTLQKKLGQGGTGAIILSVLGIVLWVSMCLSTPPPSARSAPQTRDEIFQEKVSLPTLYLTEKTKQRVVTAGSQENFVDKKTGKICWRAFECRNPDCPAKAADRNSYLFIIPEPGVFLTPDGTLGFDQEVAKKVIESGNSGGCPECLKIRDLKSESSSIRERYASYVQPHVLPETAKRLKELNEEYKRRVEWDNNQN